ncbi:alpha/beta hydrolase fold domain-containing protein [Erwinia sp. E602]|uniref:alpha/beta hydrolase n=1 Tax=Erwinia sp. E602 TaxID=2675378 RepID=UPI001BA8B26B|nr:alpha/beta hydrolase [Erwinia sp. E602]QUG73876.1 alpha/beta hydrolase fold domain-containing protein [Erwinia sp. E602]
MISRRRLLMGSGAFLLAMSTDNLFARQDFFPLWPDEPPGGGGPSGALRISSNGSWSNIVSPGIQRFVPEQPNGKAVLIAAGGGYRWIGMGREGWPVARWLNSKGYTAYVLSYRLPGEHWQDGNRVALQDAQRAIRLVRSMENNVHLLGFSAGGHLLGMAAARPDFATYAPQDSIDEIVPKADSVGLIYPVITLEPPYTHTNTHLMMVGNHPTAAEEASWSVQNYVTRAYPPLFIAQAEDDPTSDPENSVIMTDTCRRVGVPVQQIQLSRGGHGFGLGKAGTPAAIWDEAYAVWLAAR